MRSMAPRIKRGFSPSGAAFLQTRPKKTQPQTPAFCSDDRWSLENYLLILKFHINYKNIKDVH